MSRQLVARRITLVLFGVMLVPLLGLYWVGNVEDAGSSAAQRLRQGQVGAGPGGSEVERLRQEIRRKLAITWGISLLAFGVGVASVRHIVLQEKPSAE